ncbi:MAG: nucleotidyltransferase family protein [Pirellulales bacterium]
MSVPRLGPFSFEQVVRAVQRVRDRLIRAAAALETEGVRYAVAGGNAVAVWVARVDQAAVRNTQDVDILLRRADLDAADRALSSAGFIRRHVAGVELFLDGPEAKARDAVQVVFANEKVRPDHALPAPDVTDSEQAPQFRVLSLEALVRMTLTSFRRKDQVHLLDMLDVGLIDAGWRDRLPAELGNRLQELLDNPEGQGQSSDCSQPDNPPGAG